jgi:GTP-binding protein
MSHWVVVLVGRPNVGKSTLFNRIIGQRSAIVHDMPGVTRDRNYAEGEWTGKRFSLVDTGGYVPASEDIFEKAIREQAQIAIEEADVVLFIVDGQDGLLPGDKELANILRKSEKKVLLVVNKIDGEKHEARLAEFYALGLGEPYSVSALVGRKIGDLLDVVTAGFTATPDEQPDPRLKIAIIGKPNVGKSSFVNALLQQERHIVTDIPGTTRDPIDAILTFYGEEILLIDTAGLRRKSKIKESVEFYSTIRTLKSVERCDVAVVLIDAVQGLEHQDLRIIQNTIESGKPVIVAVNKWDLIEKDDSTARAFEKALKEKLRVYDFIPIMFISALTKQRIYKVIELAKQVDVEQNRKIPTSQLNALLGPDIKTFPPKSRSGKEIKIKYITQVKAKPPVFTFFCNDPKMIDDNYRRYLQNKIREHFTFRGVPVLLSFKQK